MDMNNVIKKIYEKIGCPVCPMCESDKLILSEDSYVVWILAKDRSVTNKGLELVSLVCENCGNTIFFNPNYLDIDKEGGNEV